MRNLKSRIEALERVNSKLHAVVWFLPFQEPPEIDCDTWLLVFEFSDEVSDTSKLHDDWNQLTREQRQEQLPAMREAMQRAYVEAQAVEH